MYLYTNMDYIRHSVHETYKRAAESVIPVRSKSGYQQHGVLTPNEFVIAGDYLTRVCPTWSWETSKQPVPYLPYNKQYIITRCVPCDKRATDLENYDGPGDSALDWSEEASVVNTARLSELSKNDQVSKIASDTDDDIPDIDDLISEDDKTSEHGSSGLIRKTRTYDLMISYDKYYQVPRFWLVGYDENRQLLEPKRVLEDVSEEHARKTITMDRFPHQQGILAASIHPCKHSETMKVLMNKISPDKPLAPHLYLILFMKFIGSIIPTIEYDHTMTAGQV